VLSVSGLALTKYHREYDEYWICRLKILDIFDIYNFYGVFKKNF